MPSTIYLLELLRSSSRRCIRTVVDEALENIAAHLDASSYYQEEILVRLGKPQEEHLKILESRYELVLSGKIAEKLGKTLSQKRQVLEAEWGSGL
ncbi:hypothetical protein ACFLUU_09565 [Chloroflexota bacterium]